MTISCVGSYITPSRRPRPAKALRGTPARLERNWRAHSLQLNVSAFWRASSREYVRAARAAWRRSLDTTPPPSLRISFGAVTGKAATGTAAGERFQNDIAERIDPAWKDEDIRRGVDRCQLRAKAFSKEMHIRIALAQSRKIGTIADDDLAARQVEIEESRQVFSTATRPTFRKIGRGNGRS